MSATDQPIPTTVGNIPVPASYDSAQNKWLPNTGTGGAPDIKVAGPLPAGTNQIGGVSAQGTALYPTGSTGTIPANNAATSFPISLGTLAEPGGALFDAKAVTVAIANIGTAQTINGATLVLSDAVGGQTVNINYPLGGVSIVAGASAVFVIPLDKGVLKNVTLTLTFAAAPIAGAASVQATVQGPGAPQMSLSGSGVTSAALQTAVGAAGNGAPMTVSGLATVAFTLSGTFVATVVFEGTTVATNPQPADWFSINAHQSGTTTVGTTATAPGIYRASVAGLVSVRARVSTWTSGTVTVTGTAVAVEDTSKVTAASITGSILTNVEGTTGQAAPAKALLIGGLSGSQFEAFNLRSNGDQSNCMPVALGMPGNSDGISTGYMDGVYSFGFNGNNWDRWRNNTEGTLLTSLARTAATPTPNQTNYNGKGVTVTLDVTAIGTGTLTLAIVGVIGGTKSVKLMIGAAINAPGRYTYELYPSAGAVSGEVTARSAGRLPRTWYALVTPTDASAWTYTVDHSLHV